MAELDTSQGGGKKKHGKKRTKKTSTRVDLTPMVDLGFLLVTFFMLTTTFSKPQTMEINMPVKDDPKEQSETQTEFPASKAVTLILADSNKVYYYYGLPDTSTLHKTNYAKDGLRRLLLIKKLQLKAMGGKDPEPVVMVKATEEATYKNMVDALDELNISDIKRYALVDIAPEDVKKVKNYSGE